MYKFPKATRELLQALKRGGYAFIERADNGMALTPPLKKRADVSAWAEYLVPQFGREALLVRVHEAL